MSSESAFEFFLYFRIALSIVLGLALILAISVNFKRSFHFFLLVFVPAYGLLLNLYALLAINGLTPPAFAVITPIKDYVWILVLLGFISYALVKKSTLHISSAFCIFILVPLLILFVYSLLSLMRSYGNIGLVASLLAFRNFYGYLPILFIIMYVVRSEPDLDSILSTFLIMTLAISVYAIMQFAFNIPSPYRDVMGLGGGDYSYRYVSGTFISYIELSLYLNIAIALLICARRRFPNEVWVWVTIGLAAFAIAISQSRMGMIVLTVVLLLSFLYYRVLPAASILILLPLIIMGIVIAATLSDVGRYRLDAEIIRDIRLVGGWPVLLDLALSTIGNLLWGHGFGSFGPSTTKALEFSDINMETFFVDSSLLTMLLNIGVAGLLLFSVFVVLIYAHNRRIIRNCDSVYLREILKGINLALIVILLYSIPFNTIDGFPGNVFFWFLIGLAGVVEQLCDTKACANLGPADGAQGPLRAARQSGL